MSGDLWQMARNGTTLLPSEVKKLAADYDRLRHVILAIMVPSHAVLVAVGEADRMYGDIADDRMIAMLRAAVAAAEQEA